MNPQPKPIKQPKARKPWGGAYSPAPKLRDQGPQEPPTVKPLVRGTYGGTTVLPARPQAGKIEQKVRQSIRDSAKGEECTVRISGVCNFNPETTVWSHYPLNDGAKGMGTKSLDVIGAYCCSSCHDVVDGRAPRPPGMSKDQILIDWLKGMVRSLVRLAEKGLI